MTQDGLIGFTLRKAGLLCAVDFRGKSGSREARSGPWQWSRGEVTLASCEWSSQGEKGWVLNVGFKVESV